MVVLPVMPDNTILTESKYLELKDHLFYSSEETEIERHMTWLLNQFQKCYSSTKHMYYQYLRDNDRSKIFFRTQIYSSNPEANNEFTNIYCVDPNLGEDENLEYFMFLRVHTEGVDFVANSFPFSPSQEIFNSMVQIGTKSISFTTKPFFITQHRAHIYFTTPTELLSIKISDVSQFHFALTGNNDSSMTDLLKNFRLYTNTLYVTDGPEEQIIGLKPFVNDVDIDSQLVVFCAPHHIECILVEKVLDAITEYSVDVSSAYEELTLEPVNLEARIDELKSTVRQIFSNAKREVDYSKKTDCDSFLLEVRDRVCDLHQSLFEISREIMDRMELLQTIEDEVAKRKQEIQVQLQTTRENFNINKTNIETLQANSTDLVNNTEILRETIQENLPKYSLAEENFLDEIPFYTETIEKWKQREKQLDEENHFVPFRNEYQFNPMGIDFHQYRKILTDHQNMITSLKDHVLQLQAVI